MDLNHRPADYESAEIPLLHAAIKPVRLVAGPGRISTTGVKKGVKLACVICLDVVVWCYLTAVIEIAVVLPER